MNQKMKLIWNFSCVCLFVFTVKRPNGGTVRKHTVRKLNGDAKTKETITNSDINQNNHALKDATSAKDTSNLSESTVQAFHEALHFKPLSQAPDSDDATHNNSSDQNDTVSEQARTANNIQQHNNKNNNCVGENEENLKNQALFQGISLKDFEKHHKLMQEANHEKRKLLSTAIKQR